MKLTRPYQPFLLRILHGLTGLFVVAAILTAFWTYDTYDGRWGRIPLPSYSESQLPTLPFGERVGLQNT